MTKDLHGSSHHLKLVGEAYGKRKDFIYEMKKYLIYHWLNLTFPYACVVSY